MKLIGLVLVAVLAIGELLGAQRSVEAWLTDRGLTVSFDTAIAYAGEHLLGLLALMVVAAMLIPWKKLRPTVTPVDPRVALRARTEFTDETLLLADLADSMGRINSKTFDHCVLVGPAVVAFYGELHLSDASIDAEERRAQDFFVELNTGWIPAGMLAVKDCVFRNKVVFRRISFAGPKDLLDRVKAGFAVEVAVPYSEYEKKKRDSQTKRGAR